jgi:hypothetical protein
VSSYLPRDHRGWRIPREGTVARQVYDLLINGYERKAISIALSANLSTVGVVVWRIKHPKAHNAAALKYRTSP